MKKLGLLVPCLILSIGIFGQIKGDRNGIRLFDQATFLLKQGEYKAADSIFTLALQTYRNENVYYNRAISKLMQSDTLSCCNDLNVAVHKYFDTNTVPLYHELCCIKVDTIYYDKKHRLTDKSHFKYYEEVRKLKYLPITVGILHGKTEKNIGLNVDLTSDSKIIGGSIIPTDVIAVYEVKDSLQQFIFCNNPPVVTDEDKLVEVKERFSNVFDTQFGNLKIQHQIETIRLWFQINIDSCGNIGRSSFIQITPAIEAKELEDKFKEGLSKIVKCYPSFIPAIVMNRKVNFCYTDFIEF